MTESSPSRRLLADILSSEREALGGSASAVEASMSFLERFRELLQPLIGQAGHEMLLARAAVRGAGRHDALAGLRVTTADPVPEDRLVEALRSSRDPEEAAVTLFSEMIGFLADLIGWRLTLRLLQDEWRGAVEACDVEALEEWTNMRKES